MIWLRFRLLRLQNILRVVNFKERASALFPLAGGLDTKASCGNINSVEGITNRKRYGE